MTVCWKLDDWSDWSQIHGAFALTSFFLCVVLCICNASQLNVEHVHIVRKWTLTSFVRLDGFHFHVYRVKLLTELTVTADRWCECMPMNFDSFLSG